MPNPIIDLGYRYACNRFPGDGVETDFEINFAGGYLRPEHVVGFLKDPDNNVEEPLSVSGRTLVIFGPNQVRVTPAVPDGITLVVRRDTPKEGPMLDYNDGAILNDVNLNTSNKQAIFAVAEMVDYFADFLDIFRGISEDVIDALDYAEQALLLAQQALALAQQALDRANEAYDLAEEALARANEAWDLANSKPDSFLELNDTPNSYTGEGGHVAIAKVDETGMDLVPVEEIPGLEEFIITIVEEHGGGGGGIPTTAPVVLHSPDAGIPNGLVLTEGSNITLTDNGSGGLVIAATGGGGGTGEREFRVGDETLTGDELNGFWVNPVSPDSFPEDGFDGTGGSNKDSAVIVSTSDSITGFEKSVAFGSRFSVIPTESANFGYGFSASGFGPPKIEKGFHVSFSNISIGSHVRQRFGTGSIKIDLGFDAEITDSYQSNGSLVITPGNAWTRNYLTGDLQGVYQFGNVDLGGMPGAWGFNQNLGYNINSPFEINFTAKPFAIVDGTYASAFAIGGSGTNLDFTAASADPDDLGSPGFFYGRCFLLEVKVVAFNKAAEIKAVVTTSREKNGGTKTVTIVSQDSTDIIGTGASGLAFVVNDNKLKLYATEASGYHDPADGTCAFIKRFMTSRETT